MKKIIRFYSVFILLISLMLLAVSSYSVIYSEDFSWYIGIASMIYSSDNPDKENNFDNDDWTKHWIIKNSIGSAIAFLGILFGIGLFLFKRWSRNLWLMMIVAINILFLILFFGNIYRYDFERIGCEEISIAAFLAITSCLVFCNRSAREIFNIK